MRNGSLENIVIVGGGSAGWMSAAYLAKSLPDLKITVIESSDIPTIGVGEATIASISGYLSHLGMKEEKWMPACNASFKYGIRFNDWHRKGEHYWHPFETIPYFNPHQHLGHYWYRKQLDRKEIERHSIYSDCFLSVALINENKILKTKGGPDFVHTYALQDGNSRAQIHVPYAYHFDAGLFGALLKQQCVNAGSVKHIVDDVTRVNLTEKGSIDSLEIKSGCTVSGDLFLDCTGFKSLLLGKAIKEPFESYSDTLFVDRAIALQVPYVDPKDEMQPYTTSTAKSSGWVWNIPVANRLGTGYVYCSSFSSPDEAEKELRLHLGEKRVDGLECKVLDISRVGKHRNTWVKNCVGIGLSSGFLEPIESTSLHFVYAGVAKLAEALGDGYFNAATASAYNSFITGMMEEARDYIAAHYALTQREDTDFWRQVKYDTKIPDSLANYLASCRLALPERRADQIVFKYSSWTCALAGMGFLPNPAGYANMLQQDIAQQYRFMEQMKLLGKKLGGTAINHYEYIRSMRNM